MHHRRIAVAVGTLALAFACVSAAPAAAQESDQLTNDLALAGNGPKSVRVQPNVHNNGQAHARFGIPNIDSIPNFNGHYFVDGFDASGNPNREWYYNTVGNPPQLGGSTVLNAPIIPVSLDLRNADGTPRYVNGHRLYYDATQYIDGFVNSPVFQKAQFSSSPVPTQVTDAIQRAEYAKQAKADWHTLLHPVVKTARVMTLLKGTYQFRLNPDGTCCAYVLVDYGTFVNALFPATSDDTTTPIGAAEHAGDMTTKDISTLMFPNTYLFGSFGCCVLGFHSYDVEPGNGQNIAEKRYVMNYSSWISPGLFGNAFQDVTALSHEIAETFNDPFVVSDGVHDLTPWWLAPNGNCDDSLETGDVIEGLPNATFPMTMNGFTYHPQNEALLQWFAGEWPSSALGGAYSYPDTTVLTAPPAPQLPGCR